MIPVWIWWPALILTIAALGALLLWHTTRTIAAGREGETWRRVRVYAGHTAAAMRRTAARQIADAADLARLTAPYAPPRADLTGSPWTSGGEHLHYVGRPIATHRSDETATATGHVGRHREPSTIGERAAWRFPADTHEFTRTFGTVEIGQAA